ncbi:MAG: hypothetical protein V4662_02985 [Verrucomicrobiota bacterium]
MSQNTLSHRAEAGGGATFLENMEAPACGYTVKAAILDDRRKLIIEGWFHAAERDSTEGILFPFLYRRFPFDQDGEPIGGACFLQFERGMFLITKAVYSADDPHVEITRELPQKRERQPRHLV